MNEDWQSDDDDDDGGGNQSARKRDAQEEEEDKFAQLEEIRNQLENELGCDKFIEAYRAAQVRKTALKKHYRQHYFISSFRDHDF